MRLQLLRRRPRKPPPARGHRKTFRLTFVRGLRLPRSHSLRSRDRCTGYPRSALEELRSSKPPFTSFTGTPRADSCPRKRPRSARADGPFQSRPAPPPQPPTRLPSRFLRESKALPCSRSLRKNGVLPCSRSLRSRELRRRRVAPASNGTFGPAQFTRTPIVTDVPRSSSTVGDTLRRAVRSLPPVTHEDLARFFRGRSAEPLADPPRQRAPPGWTGRTLRTSRHGAREDGEIAEQSSAVSRTGSGEIVKLCLTVSRTKSGETARRRWRGGNSCGSVVVVTANPDTYVRSIQSEPISGNVMLASSRDWPGSFRPFSALLSRTESEVGS